MTQITPALHHTLPLLRSRPLRIMIDARKIGEGGIGVYLENLLRGLHYYRAPSHEGERPIPTVRLTALVREGREALVRRIAPDCELVTTSISPYSLDELFLLNRYIPQERIDLFHTPHFVLPYFLTIPSVVTVHDLTHLLFPERWYYPLVAKFLMRSAVRRAARVITVSNSSRNDILHLIARRPKDIEKIRIVPNSLDPSFVTQTLSNPSLNGKSGYFLAVLSMHKPHKGLSDLIAAWKHITQSPDLKERIGDKQLIIAGIGTRQLSEDSRMLTTLCDTSRVIVRGGVSSDELRKLYIDAEALIVPSRAEGFGLPMLEAHALGTPVIFRPVPALTELATEIDIRCKSFSIEDLAQGILTYLSGREDRIRMRAHCRDRIRQQVQERYSIRGTTEATLRVYAEALGVPLQFSRGEQDANPSLTSDRARSSVA